MTDTAEIKRLTDALRAIRSIAIAAQVAADRVTDPVLALRPAIRNIREAAEDALDPPKRRRQRMAGGPEADS